jgi:hypothetical protein
MMDLTQTTAQLGLQDVLIEPCFTTALTVPEVPLQKQGVQFILPCLFQLSPLQKSSIKLLRDNGMGVHLPPVAHSELQDDLFNLRLVDMDNPVFTITFGLGELELERIQPFLMAKYRYFCLEVPHGAQQAVLEQVVAFRMLAPDAVLSVGDFFSMESIDRFVEELNHLGAYRVDFWQVALENPQRGFGMGLATTIAQCAQAGYPIVAKGAFRCLADVVKVLAAGARFAVVNDAHHLLHEVLQHGGLEGDDYATLEQTITALKSQLQLALMNVNATNLDEFYNKAQLKWIQF